MKYANLKLHNFFLDRNTAYRSSTIFVGRPDTHLPEPPHSGSSPTPVLLSALVRLGKGWAEDLIPSYAISTGLL